MSETYVPLARKWRPRTFSDVVGQEEIVRALSNAVSQDRLAHAYLFSGPRGVGKTTNARLLASAINCRATDRPTATPCGTCESCTEIFEGRSIDALEIDGATHGKVDQARDLIELVSYAPVRDRRKVFIIDEVHAISSAAFQALLKTLEEPPSHAVFILATTERHKIPATILSRCQRFDFRRLTDDEVAERLADVAKREGYEVLKEEPAAPSAAATPRVSWGALLALAAASTGSLRDGLSLFDQAVARAGAAGLVTTADVSALLGAPDRTALVNLLASILAGDRSAVLRGAAELEATGADPRTTLHDLTALVRGVVRLAIERGAAPPAGLSEDGATRLGELARRTPYATLLRSLSLLSESDGVLRRSDVPALVFEVLVLKLTELSRVVLLEDLLSGKAPLPDVPAAGAPAVSRKAVPEDAPSAPVFNGLRAQDVEAPAAADPATAFRHLVEKRQVQLAAVLEDAAIRVEGKAFRIVLDASAAGAEKRLLEPSMKRILDESAAAVLGRGASVVVEGAPVVATAAPAPGPEARERDALRARVASDERVKKMLDLFDGEITEVRADRGRG